MSKFLVILQTYHSSHGIQIGLIALSVIVTKSSIESLQSRNGLPLGNQVVGWIVLGEYRSFELINNVFTDTPSLVNMAELYFIVLLTLCSFLPFIAISS